MPQGSVLGPLLFLLYINDLCSSNFSNMITSYADDTVLLYLNENFANLISDINFGLKKVNNWFFKNCLNINYTKTILINFNLRKQEQIDVRIHSVTCNYIYGEILCNCPRVKQVSSFKYLGVYIDSNLGWKSHLHHITSKLRYFLRILYFLKPKVTFLFLKILYFAWINSVLSYGILCWGGEYITNLQLINKTLQKINKLILSSRSDNEVKPFYNFNVRKLYVLKAIKFIHKNPNYFNRISTHYDTRQNFIYLTPKAHKEILHHNFAYLGPKLYNNIPRYIVNENNFTTLIRLLKIFLYDSEEIETWFQIMK